MSTDISQTKLISLNKRLFGMQSTVKQRSERLNFPPPLAEKLFSGFPEAALAYRERGQLALT